MSVDSELYKQAMRRLGGGTCVVTAAHQGQRSGLTATSVASVAAEPAELLVCVNQQTSAWPLIRDSGQFGVNIVSTDQQPIALQFAGVGGVRGEQRYANANWSEHNGIWLLDNALAALACEVTEVIIRHSHALVLGRVEQVVVAAESNEASPLLYWHGQFGTFSSAC